MLKTLGSSTPRVIKCNFQGRGGGGAVRGRKRRCEGPGPPFLPTYLGRYVCNIFGRQRHGTTCDMEH